MRIDFKVITWEQVEFDADDELKAEVLEKLKSGEITTANDLWELKKINEEQLGLTLMYETETAEQGQVLDGPTIEVFDDDEDETLLWHN